MCLCMYIVIFIKFNQLQLYNHSTKIIVDYYNSFYFFSHNSYACLFVSKIQNDLDMKICYLLYLLGLIGTIFLFDFAVLLLDIALANHFSLTQRFQLVLIDAFAKLYSELPTIVSDSLKSGLKYGYLTVYCEIKLC